MDYLKLKDLIDDKSVAIYVSGNVIRVNIELGNDKSWHEFEIDGRDEIQMAALINTHISKMRTGKISQL